MIEKVPDNSLSKCCPVFMYSLSFCTFIYLFIAQ